MESAASAANSRSTSHTPSRAQSPDHLPKTESSYLAVASVQSNSTHGPHHTSAATAVHDMAPPDQPAARGADTADIQDAAEMGMPRPSSCSDDVNQSVQQSSADASPDQQPHSHATDGSLCAAGSMRPSLQSNSAASMHSNAGVISLGHLFAAGHRQPLPSAESQASSSVTGSKVVSPLNRGLAEATSHLSHSPVASLESREDPMSANADSGTSINPQPVMEQPEAGQLQVIQAAPPTMAAKDLAPNAELQAAHLHAPALPTTQEASANSLFPTDQSLPV